MSGPSSLWLVAQRPSREQRRHRYLPESSSHPAKMAPALARQAIRTYTSPGDVVIDPMCGIGTTLVEAAHLGRDSFGIEYEPRWAALAQANLALAKADGAPGEAEITVGDCRDLLPLLPAGMTGQVALVLTSPPYGPSTHGLVSCDSKGVPSGDELLGRPVQPCLRRAAVAADRDGGVTARRPLGAHGVVVLTARPWRRDGALIDLPGQLITAAEKAGLVIAERNVALLAAVRNGALVPRASFFQLNDARKARQAGLPQRVIGHEDVLVLRGRR